MTDLSTLAERISQSERATGHKGRDGERSTVYGRWIERASPEIDRLRLRVAVLEALVAELLEVNERLARVLTGDD